MVSLTLETGLNSGETENLSAVLLVHISELGHYFAVLMVESLG